MHTTTQDGRLLYDWLMLYITGCTFTVAHESTRIGIHEMNAWVWRVNDDECPPKHPFVFVSWSDLPVCTNRLYQPAFGF